MTDVHIVGMLAAALSILASMLCAARLSNWRHPILFVGIFSAAIIPVIFAKHVEPIQPSKIDITSLILKRYEELKHGRSESQMIDSNSRGSYAAQIGR